MDDKPEMPERSEVPYHIRRAGEAYLDVLREIKPQYTWVIVDKTNEADVADEAKPPADSQKPEGNDA